MISTTQNIFPELVGTPANPVPVDVTIHDVTTRDGVHLRVASWAPVEGPARGVVTILQGRGEFIEKYFETISELRQRGFHVVAFDWRGQGGSQRLLRRRDRTKVQPGHIRDFADYQCDLDAVLAQVVTPLGGARFALTHSMGGAIALTRAARKEHGRDFDRIVAVAPLIALSQHIAPGYAGPIARVAAAIGLARMRVPGGRKATLAPQPFAGNLLTSDETRFKRIQSIVQQAPWLCVANPTFGWLAAAARVMARLASPGFALRVATPALVIAAGNDRIVSTAATERFCARLKTGNALVLPYARHEILIENDDIRAAFWAAFDAFVPGKGLIGTVEPDADQLPRSAKAAS